MGRLLMGSLTTVVLLTLSAVQSVDSAMAFVSDKDFTRWEPVSERVLGSMRGGFQSSAHGPILSFGIERSVFLNGELVASTVLNISDVTKLITSPSNTVTLIQQGSGNVMTPDVSALPPLATVIQNTLDHQTIQSQTVLNATVAALSWARSVELGNALSQATAGTIRH